MMFVILSPWRPPQRRRIKRICFVKADSSTRKSGLRMTAFLHLLFLSVAWQNVAVLAGETVQAVFDERQWKLGLENFNPEKKAVIKEYVPDGQTVEAWNELITLQFFEGLQNKVSVAHFLEEVQGGLRIACPSVQWSTVSEAEKEAVYRWSIQGCSGQLDQTEITRVVAGQEGMHIWHYAAKDPKLPLGKQKEWIDRLNEFRLKTKEN